VTAFGGLLVGLVGCGYLEYLVRRSTTSHPHHPALLFKNPFSTVPSPYQDRPNFVINGLR
jgi:hypothetical protein